MNPEKCQNVLNYLAINNQPKSKYNFIQMCWKNFEYLKRELTLLREKCTLEEYKELAFAGVDKAYTNFKHAYPDQTTDWADDVYAQFSILCTTKESLDEWNALHL